MSVVPQDAVSDTVAQPADGERRVLLAFVRRPWGRNGDVVLDLHTDWPAERFAPGRELRLEWEDGRSLTATVETFREQQSGALLRFVGVTSISDADRYRDAWIVADAQTLSRPDPDAITYTDIAGLAVVDVRGAGLGTVAGVEETPGGNLLRVALTRGGECLVPLADKRSVTIDLAQRRVVLDPPAGLIDPHDAEPAGDAAAPVPGKRRSR